MAPVRIREERQSKDRVLHVLWSRQQKADVRVQHVESLRGRVQLHTSLVLTLDGVAHLPPVGKDKVCCLIDALKARQRRAEPRSELPCVTGQRSIERDLGQIPMAVDVRLVRNPVRVEKSGSVVHRPKHVM